MTEAWTYTLAAGGELISRGQTETKTNVSTPVPEPNDLTLLWFGLLALGAIARQRITNKTGD